MQVSGLKFNVDISIQSPVVMDEKDLFLHVKEGKRRVSDLCIWDKENETYQPVDLERRYSLASFSYQLKDLGSSGIFRYTELKEDNLGLDVEVLASYIEQVLNGKISKQNTVLEERIVIKLKTIAIVSCKSAIAIVLLKVFYLILTISIGSFFTLSNGSDWYLTFSKSILFKSMHRILLLYMVR